MIHAHRWASWVAIAALSSACGGFTNGTDPSPVARGKVVADRTNFPAVADALQTSCGTLDCHGQVARNWRLFGGHGLRLDPNGNSTDDPTTDAEYEATYRSTVFLEPEALSDVLTDQGSDPERLSIIRKARGTERHKGGTQMLVGDPLDRCLISWLESKTDTASCDLVWKSPRPDYP